MALRKRFSKVFKSPESAIGASARDPLPREQVERAAAPDALSPITEDDQNDEILAATQASYESEISRLKGNAQERQQHLQRREHEQFRAAQEIESLQNRLSASESQVQHLKTQFQTTSNQLRVEQEKNSRLERETTALQHDFQAMYSRCQQYATLNDQLRTSGAEEEKKIHKLEERLSLALQSMGSGPRRAYQEGSMWMREKEELQATWTSQTAITNQRIQTLIDDLQRKDELCGVLHSQVSAVAAELKEEKSQHLDSRAIIQALQIDQASVQKELDQKIRQMALFQSLFGPCPTPRQVLFLLLSVGEFDRLPRTGTVESNFGRSHRFEHLMLEDMDVPLSEGAFPIFANSVNVGSSSHNALQSFQFTRCSECKKHRLDSRYDHASRDLVELPKLFQETHCDPPSVCKDCLKEKIKKSIMEDWWYELDCEQWLKCPILGCQHSLSISRAEDLDNLLRDYTETEIAPLKAMFLRAQALREALIQTNLCLSLEAISVAIGLYAQLSAFRLYSDLFSIPTNDGPNLIDLFEAGDIIVGDVDRNDLKIPIFTKFFRRSETPKDCLICVESFYEVDVESEEQWKSVCDGYAGSWMSRVFSFPTKDILKCEHDMTSCKGCIAQHLKSQVDQHGRNARGRLTCPICNRVLSEDEIRCLGSAETVEKYDHYLLLSHLSSDPNFRHCLGTDCDNGEIYEQDEYPNPHIVCSSCEFEMCFEHQIPWHTGLSCEQYDSIREHGDPDYQQTQDWMRNNSKNCPGTNCGINIEKGNACFHMTCSNCNHGFCWECLGDWSRINPEPGTYVKEEHNTGCWFRDSELQPTQISGTDLQEALRRRGVQ